MMIRCRGFTIHHKEAPERVEDPTIEIPDVEDGIQGGVWVRPWAEAGFDSPFRHQWPLII